MNLSKRHRPMAMRILSGIPVMCMAMDPTEQIECVPTSSRENPSLAAPTRWASSLMTEMVFEVMTEWRS